MERAWPIAWHLYFIVLVTAAPMCIYIAADLTREAADAEEEAERLVLSLATSAAAGVRARLSEAEGFARAVAARPLVRALDASRCDPLFQDLLPLLPQYANISVVDRERRFLCSGFPIPESSEVPMHRGLRGALEGHFTVSEPRVGVLFRKLIVSAVQPILGAQDTVAGALTLSIDLASLRPVDDALALPRQARVRIIDDDGILVASSTRNDPELGRAIGNGRIARLALGGGTGTARVRDSDGIERLYGYTSVAGYRWHAYAGVRMTDLLAPAQERMLQSATLAGALLATALVAAAFVSRRITRPAAALEGAIDTTAAGRPTHAEVAGPRELRALAANYNRMLDVTIEARRELRALSQRMLDIEENERRTVSRELHDRTGADLAALHITLGLLEEACATGKTQDACDLVADAREVLANVSSELRDIMSEMRPPALDDFGLYPALVGYARRVTQRLGLHLATRGGPVEPRPAPAVETALYRIAQEALTNVAKHAHASTVDLELHAENGSIVLTVADDGVGFDERAGGGLGMRTMRERAEAIDARFSVSAGSGKGTRITVEARLG